MDPEFYQVLHYILITYLLGKAYLMNVVNTLDPGLIIKTI